MQVNREMLEAILDASISTARSFRGRAGELYALGQLEATANMVYVMICAQNSTEYGQLEVRCQSAALEALERMGRLQKHFLDDQETQAMNSIAQFSVNM